MRRHPEPRCASSGVVLLALVLVLERKNRIDHEQEHEHDCDEGGAPPASG